MVSAFKGLTLPREKSSFIRPVFMEHLLMLGTMFSLGEGGDLVLGLGELPG